MANEQPSYEQGPHRGRGPRGYRRSDERIREDVNDRLTDDPRIDASDIEVVVAGCEVTLNGTVHQSEDTRRAQEIVEQVRGVSHVQNNLHVQQSADLEPAGGGAGDATNYPRGTVGPGNLARE